MGQACCAVERDLVKADKDEIAPPPAAHLVGADKDEIALSSKPPEGPQEGLDAHHKGPSAFLTSNCFHKNSQWVKFIQVMLNRRGALRPEDASPSATREGLVKKYANELKKLKVTYINDASFHRDEIAMTKGRDERKWKWWDIEFHEKMGIPTENITMIQVLEKPWLFNRPGRISNYHKQEPNVPNLDPEDEKKYYAALQLTQDAYNALKKDPPMVGAGQAGGYMAGCPRSGMNCANELAAVSRELNDKYPEALDKWCTEYFDGADIIAGQGGEVVMLNMAWGCNQTVASRLISAVKANKPVYCSLSASTMVTAASMEMTGEIQPGWIEAFAIDGTWLQRNKHFKPLVFEHVDTHEQGTQVHVLGNLPLFQSPWAIRPHYSEAWMQAVLEKNLIAEKEFEEETGIEVDDQLVADSKNGVDVALRLLNIISANSKQQDHPVFVPMRDGVAVEVDFYDEPYREVFTKIV
jgi:hypothetical protein